MSILKTLSDIFTPKPKPVTHDAINIAEYASDTCFRDLAQAYQDGKTEWAFAHHAEKLLEWSDANQVDLIPSQALEARIKGFLSADPDFDNSCPWEVRGFQIALGNRIYDGVWYETPQNSQTYIINEQGKEEPFFSTHPPQKHNYRRDKKTSFEYQ